MSTTRQVMASSSNERNEDEEEGEATAPALTSHEQISISQEPTQEPLQAQAQAQAPDRTRHIQIRNRRKAYLDKNPDYFSSDLELADPLLYDRLIRKFQTPAEREAEGRAKGYSGTLEADILRSEAKVSALAGNDSTQPLAYPRAADGSILAEEAGDAVASKEAGLALWRKSMELRFMRGDDDQFDYSIVDDNEEFDDHVEKRRDDEDRYFGSEEPSWASSEAGIESEVELVGETGIQDF